MDLLEEVPLRVVSVDAPPIIDDHIEDGENQDEEGGRPFSLEANCNHATGN